MSWIRCVVMSVMIFSPAMLHSGVKCIAAVGNKFAEGGVLLLASCAVGALFTVLLKHVTNTSVHLDPKNPVVTKEAHQLSIAGLGRSIDTVRDQGTEIKDSVTDLSEKTDSHGEILATLCAKLDLLLPKKKSSRKKKKAIRS